MFDDIYTPDESEDLLGPSWDEEEYPAWTEATSRVISGPLGEARFPGTRFAAWQEARSYAESKYRVLKFGCIPGRWFARIVR